MCAENNATDTARPLSYVIFSALYAPHTGGVETYTAGLAAELAQRGHRVTVVTSRLSPAHPERETQPDGVDVLRLPCRPLLDGRLPLPQRNAAFHHALDELAAKPCDRVVVNTRFYGLSLDGVRFARRVGAHALVVEHGSAHLSLGNPLADRMVEAYEHHATKRVAAEGFPFCAVSQASATWLEHFGLECSGIVPNALDARTYADNASTRDFRAELGIDPSTFLVAFVGRLVPEKGVDALLEAGRLLAAQAGASNSNEPDASLSLVFAGDGPLLSTVQEAARTATHTTSSELDTSSKIAAPDKPDASNSPHAASVPVFALGRQDAPDVAALLRTADALCLPSRSEGFSTTLLEAAAMGCMPIVTDVGGAREIGVDDTAESTGVLLPSIQAHDIAEALTWAMSHRDACATRSLTLATRVRERNGWTQSASALEALFDQVECTASDACDLSTGGDQRLEKLHGALLLMLKDFSAFCTRENLDWVVMYGSAIGVLRHGGFIPWDDDIDIAMPRADLERLAAAAASDPVFSQRYCMVDAQTNPRYPMATARLMLRDTEFRDSALASMDFDSGIFLDLFPLDDLADDKHAFRRQAWRAWLYNKLAIAQLTRNPYIAGTGMRAAVLKGGSTVARVVLNLPGVRSMRLNARSLAWQTRYQGQPTRRIGFLCDTGRFWDVYERADVFPVRMAPFEDMEVPLAHNAEKLLTTLYGDFMTPPPVDARAEHYPDVLDLGPWENAQPLTW